MRSIQLLGLSLFATACATNAAKVPPRSVPTTPVAATSSSTAGEEIVARTNVERLKRGLPELPPNASLMRAALIHATQMAAQRKMAHDLPGTQYPTMATRLAAVGYRMMASGENVAEGYPTPSAVVAGWMTSAAHRDNITSTRFTEMGAAVATGSNGRLYYAQVFARPR